MTIKQREHIQTFSHQKEVMISDGKIEKLGESVEKKLVRMSNLRQNLCKELRLAAAHQEHVEKHSRRNEQAILNRKMKDKGMYSREERQLEKDRVNEENGTAIDNDHLLILVHSAELMLEAENRFNEAHQSDQSGKGLHITPMVRHSSENNSVGTAIDQKSFGNQIHGMPVIDHLRSEENGFQWEGGAAHTSHILCHAQPRIGDYAGCHLQGRRIRLTQIRRQARSKSHLELQNKIDKFSCGNSQGRIIRLSHWRHLARSKGNSLVQEQIEGHRQVHMNCQTLRDNQRETIMAAIFGENNFQVVNEEALDNKMPVKGKMRLTQIRRKARLGKC